MSCGCWPSASPPLVCADEQNTSAGSWFRISILNRAALAASAHSARIVNAWKQLQQCTVGCAAFPVSFPPAVSSNVTVTAPLASPPDGVGDQRAASIRTAAVVSARGSAAASKRTKSRSAKMSSCERRGVSISDWTSEGARQPSG